MSRAQWAWLALLSACIGACKQGPEAMQTIVLIDADREVRESLAGEVYVSRSTDNELLHTVALPPRAWPIKFVLAPEAQDAQRRFSVTFSNTSGVPFGFQVSAGFVAGRTRTLHLQIANSCALEESSCRVGCGLIDIKQEAMQASAEMKVPITCMRDPDAEMNMTGETAGAGGSAAVGGSDNPNMINVGTRAGASAAGSRAPAAGSGGVTPPAAGKSAPPPTAGSQQPPPATGACGADTCGAHGKCAADGSCECDLGFVSAGTGKACVDVDECQQTPRPCGAGQCLNLEGDFSCECSGETWAKADKHSCGSFSKPETLTPKYSSAVPCQPQLAFYSASADQPGKGLAIWITGDSTQALWSASYDASTGWTLATQPITSGVTDLDSPRLLLNPTTGDGFAIWLQNGGSEIRYALRREGKFAPSASLTLVEGAAASFLSAALSANGDGYATWSEFSGDTSAYRSRVMVARFLGRTTQTWIGKLAIAGGDGSENAAVSRVAVDGQGRATLVWTGAPIVDGGTPSLIGKSYVARYDPSATTVRAFWSSDVLDNLASGLADVAFEPGGKGVSIWQRQALSTSTGIAVAASRYVGASWVGPSSVSSASELTLMLPRVGVMPSGAAFAMWTQQSSGALNVYGSMLDATSGKWSSPAISLSPQSSTPPPFMGGWGDIYFDLIDLAVDEVGGGVGVFSEFNNTNRVIRAVHTREGVKDISGPLEIVRDTTPIKPSRVEVGLDKQGAGALIWDQPISASPPSYQVFVSRIE